MNQKAVGRRKSFERRDPRADVKAWRRPALDVTAGWLTIRARV
jgi:hypothetical protein